MSKESTATEISNKNMRVLRKKVSSNKLHTDNQQILWKWRHDNTKLGNQLKDDSNIRVKQVLLLPIVRRSFSGTLKTMPSS